MVIEFARHVLNITNANSSEMDPNTPNPVIDLLPEQRNISSKGATMRLGSYPCVLDTQSKAGQLYGEAEISERHRHRYEFNNLYRDEFANSDLKIVGTSPNKSLVELVELKNHPFFIGCQFHPEFQSQIAHAHPLFRGLVEAALIYQESKNAKA